MPSAHRAALAMDFGPIAAARISGTGPAQCRTHRVRPGERRLARQQASQLHDLLVQSRVAAGQWCTERLVVDVASTHSDAE